MHDRLVRAIITGDASGAIKSFEETSLAAGKSGSGIAKGLAVGVGAVVTAGTAVAAVAVKMATDFRSPPINW